jgi:hypothetical protein
MLNLRQLNQTFRLEILAFNFCCDFLEVEIIFRFIKIQTYRGIDKTENHQKIKFNFHFHFSLKTSRREFTETTENSC